MGWDGLTCAVVIPLKANPTNVKIYVRVCKCNA